MALNFKNFKDKLGKMSKKVIRAKDSDGHEVEVEVIEDADKTADDIPVPDIKAKKKPVLKPIQILIVLLLLAFLLTDDEILSSKTDQIIKSEPIAEISVPTTDPINQDELPSEDSTEIKEAVTPEVSMEETPATPETSDTTPEVSMEETPATPEISDTTPEVSMEETPSMTETSETTPEVSMEETPSMTETSETTPEVSMEETPSMTETSDTTPEVSMEETPATTETSDTTPEVFMEETPSMTETSDTTPEVSMEDTSSSEAIGDLPLEMDKIEKPVETNSEELGQINSDELELANEVLSDDNADKLLEEIQSKLKQDKLLDEQKSELSKNHPAPDYTRFGRGLVYNCIGKHWSCIDAIAYKQCQGNNQWFSSQNMSLECIPENVYASTADCERAQQKAMVANSMTNTCK